MALALFVFSSCMPETPEPPYGVWVSENPKIVLYLVPEYRIPLPSINYLALYVNDGVETKALAEFGNGLMFFIYDLTDSREMWKLGSGISHSGRLLGGTYQVAGGEIRLHHPDQLGNNSIIFRRVESYESIDPYYGLPEFFPH